MNKQDIAKRVIAAVFLATAAVAAAAEGGEDRETYLEEAREAVEAQGRAALDALESDMRNLETPELELPVRPEALARAVRKKADAEEDRG